MNSMAASCDSTLDDSVAGDVDDSESTGNIHADDASAKLLASHRPGFRRKTPLETVLVMGIMAVASLVNTQDFLLRNRVLELLKKALWGVAEADFTMIYCGASVAISFRSDPEVALQTAQLLRGLAAQRYGHIRSYAGRAYRHPSRPGAGGAGRAKQGQFARRRHQRSPAGA